MYMYVCMCVHIIKYSTEQYNNIINNKDEERQNLVNLSLILTRVAVMYFSAFLSKTRNIIQRMTKR